MIDVMFLLLVFYILSTAALVHQQTLPVDLPVAATARSSSESPDVNLTLTREGELFLDSRKVTLEGLNDAVEQLAARRPGGLRGLQEDGMVLSADRQVSHGQVVDVMDRLRLLGITRFGIAVEQQSGR